jgi:CRP-like cAMP-binding protein
MTAQERMEVLRGTQLFSNASAEEAASRGTGEDGISFSLPDRHQRIAAVLGSVREVITRILNRFANEQLIAVHGHRITILDASALQAKAKMHLPNAPPHP